MSKLSKAKAAEVISLFSEVEKKIANSRQVGNFTSAKDLLSRYQPTPQNKHIAYEFQSFGCHMADVLADKKHTSLYIKLAKTMSRGLLERALSFVSDSTIDNKAKLFMWKLEQLKQENKKSAK